MDAELNHLCIQNIMRKKSTPHHAEPANRPFFLGTLILAAGAYSSWYWYKPLPDLHQNVVSSPWEQDRSAEWNWTDSAILRPTLEDLQSPTTGNNMDGSNMANHAMASGSSADLVPPPDLPRTGTGLLAAPNIKWQLNASTQLEPPPESPNIQILDEAIVGTVKPWVDYDMLSEESVADVQYNWPTKERSPLPYESGREQTEASTRAVLSSGSLAPPIAPNAGNSQSPQGNSLFAPEQRQAAPLPASRDGFVAPKLLDANNKRIRIREDDSLPSQTQTDNPTEFMAIPPRTPHFIRQPKSN